jgi:hypothetical protein
VTHPAVAPRVAPEHDSPPPGPGRPHGNAVTSSAMRTRTVPSVPASLPPPSAAESARAPGSPEWLSGCWTARLINRTGPARPPIVVPTG